MRLTSILAVRCSLLLCAALPLAAQDFDKVAPKPVPSIPPQPLPATEPPKVIDDRTPLVAKLKGVVILDSIAAVKSTAETAVGLVPSTTDLTQTDAFRALVAPYLGKPLDMGGLNQLSRAIILHFRKADRPVVDVVVPEQDITAGTLQIVIIEGRAGRVRVEGNRWFSTRRIGGQVRLQPGEPIRASVLQSDLAWINQNPFRTVDVVFSPGENPGETDLVFRTQDRLPLRLYTGYENTGNDLTGETRLFAGVNWGNAFGLDGQLNYQFGTSDDFDAVRTHSVTWTQPLPWRHTLTLFGAHVNSEAKTGPFTLSGESSQAGLRYTVPLPAIGAYTHEVYAGFDWKRADNALEFGIPITNSLTQIGQGVLGYRGALRDRFGVTQLQLEGFRNAAGLLSQQNPADYAGSRPGADPDFSYVRVDLSRQTRLPADFTLSHSLSAQLASTNLLPSEQLPVGGRGSVRGYEENALTASDEGWTIQNELRTPAFSVGGWVARQLGGQVPSRWHDQLQFLVFYDYGQAHPDDGATGLTTLAAVGAGVRYSVGSHVNVQADYGHRLRDIPGDNDDGRWHLSAMLSW